MPINVSDVMQLLCQVCEVRGMKTVLVRSEQGTLMVVVGASLGGLMGGRLGIAVGGALGGLVGANMTSGKIKPVRQIPMELPPVEKHRLYIDVRAIIWNLDWMDIAHLTALVMRNEGIQEKLLMVVKNYLNKELRAQNKCTQGTTPINVSDVMQLLCQVCEVRGMETALIHSGRGKLMAGVGAFLGGLMGGPLGIAVGGTAGGLVGAKMTSRKFKSVRQILMELPAVKQQLLYNEVRAIIQNLDWMDIAHLTALVMGNAGIQEKLLMVVKNYLKRELRAEIK